MSNRSRVQLRPLTPAESEVAEKNLYLVFRFLKIRKLDVNEWFDVVIFRYLQTIIKWFERPELYVYEFSTVVFRGMDSAVSSERMKQSRRIQTISLDDLIPGSEDITWGDIVTEDNLCYTPYITQEARV